MSETKRKIETKGSRHKNCVNLGFKMDRNPTEVKRPDNQEKRIIIETKATPLSRLTTILFIPALVAAGVIRIFAKGHNSYPFSLDHVLGFAFIAAPFALFISYKMLKAFGTKVILTNQKVINKTSFGEERQFYWGEIKKINIAKNTDTNCFHFIFSKKKRSVPFDNDSRIFCPPEVFFGKTNMSEDATSLILNKIDLYKIPVKGEKGLLEELSKRSGQLLKK